MTRSLVDAHLPLRLVRLLREQGHDVVHTTELSKGFGAWANGWARVETSIAYNVQAPGLSQTVNLPGVSLSGDVIPQGAIVPETPLLPEFSRCWRGVGLTPCP